ncbi:MAG: heme NO-binding domain-containing protein [Acidimicrobiia bacterium]|nr:heme NO-binding domain-containing protein [Acidimicrobiia bacterium]
MKGIVFNAAEKAVTSLMGADTWDDLLDAAGSDGVYTALGTYPDEDLLALVMAASEATGHSPADVQRLIGRHALEHLIPAVADLVDTDGSVFDFLASVHEIIHIEVKKLSPDARPPDLVPELLATDLLQLTYRSERGLSALAEGLILGAGDIFAQPVIVSVPDDLQSDGETVIHVHRVGP